MAKHEIPRAPRRRARGRKRGLLLLAVAAVLVAAVSASLAFLLLRTEPVKNTFEPGIVSCAVEEEFTDGLHKTDVKVKNTGNVSAYIRVKLLPYWYDQTEDKVVAKSAWEPAFTPGEDWVLGADGFYYYTKPVAAGDCTGVLISEITLAQDGVTLSRQVLEIIASCVQAQPDAAVKEAWGDPNGSVTDVSGNALAVTTPAPTTGGGA